MKATVQQPDSAQVVGNTFTQQYYRILHQSPGLVYRFYQGISKLGRPDENGIMSITTTMQAINDKILSLNNGEFKAEIKSVDAQESFDGGVHVLVTGCLIGKDNVIRNFSQSFFLAPQDKGYFVLNDMFRYVEDVNHHAGNQDSANDVEAPLTPEQDPSPLLENHISEQTTVMEEEANGKDVYNPSDNGEVSVVEEEEADGYSIYIKGLPLNATLPLLEDEFKRFGPIKNGGIQVRSNRQEGFCFGCVEFEVASAVQQAIEASPIMIGGRQAYVEEKRSTNSRVNNRGRLPNGRGSSFQNEGVRWRGNYGGGRGYSQGDFNGRAEFGNRGSNRGGFSNRGGDGYQRADSNGGHVNRAGGMAANGTPKTMAPRLPATDLKAFLLLILGKN
ncbi:hypothetical protein F0562_002271 [Nyssa sinensis]|uniref:NTF2 domain-containing protein n=1 Tax=Nyssa sinensis TaxID=561372 RepID=A0A5J5C978_9ASTE|nr:hypothetical protein F0562_002271 [Nyssa sinensis]